MRDLRHLKSNSAKLAQEQKEKTLFRSQRKAVNAGANGTLEYTIKEGVNKSKIADAQLIKNKK
tara:strand:- start:1109 stop:1297 length:189 start_codon:yes stop_codon:yes gene_type:complete